MLPDCRWRELHGQGTQDGCCLVSVHLLLVVPASSISTAHMTGLSTLLFPRPSPVIILRKGAGSGGPSGDDEPT